MTKEAIADRLKEIIKPYVPDQQRLEELNANTDLLQDLEINSANLVDIIIDVEMAFDIEIDDAAAEQMLTVKDAIAIIQERLAE